MMKLSITTFFFLLLLLLLAVGGSIGDENIPSSSSSSSSSSSEEGSCSGSSKEESCDAAAAASSSATEVTNKDDEEDNDDDLRTISKNNDEVSIDDDDDDDDDDNENDEEHFCKDCNTEDLWEELECGDYHLWDMKQIPTVEDFMAMRRAYVEVVDDVDDNHKSIKTAVEQDAFLVGIEAKQAGGKKGRGVFATEFIPQGTPVRTGKQVAHFYEMEDFRNFLGELFPHHKYSACDILDWAYVAYKDDDDDEDRGAPRWTLSVDLDHGALINHAQTKEEINLDCGDDVEIALQDIQQGEELLCDYNEFEPDNDKGWKTLGMEWESWGEYNHTADTNTNATTTTVPKKLWGQVKTFLKKFLKK